MNKSLKNAYRVSIIVALSFAFMPSFSQTWQKLWDQAIRYQDQHDTLNTNRFAEQAFQKAKSDFSPSDSRYQQTLDLYVKSTLQVLDKLGDKGKPLYTATLLDLSKMYSESGNRNKSDSLIGLSRENEIECIKSGDLSWEELATRITEYRGKGDIELAIVCAEMVKQKAELEYGKKDFNYGIALNNLGLLNYSAGNYKAAEPFFRQALEILKNTEGSDQSNYANSLNNLGLLYYTTGNYNDAEPLYLLATEIYKNTIGIGNNYFATSLCNLGILYVSLGRYQAAEPILKQVIEIREKVLGIENNDYATAINNLGMLYQHMGNFEAAEPYIRKSLEIAKKTVGIDNNSYATSLNNLAAFYQEMGNYAEAESLFVQALEIIGKTVGSEHVDYARSLNNLALLRFTMGDYQAAESFYLQVLTIERKAVGPEHPQYALSLRNLANLYYSMGNYTAAEPLYQQTLTIVEKAIGKEHIEYARTLNQLAMLKYVEGDLAEAETIYLKSLNIIKKSIGVTNSDYALVSNNLAMLYSSSGDYRKAETLYSEALDIQKKVVGTEHIDYALVLDNLASLYFLMKKYTAAEPLFQQALEIRKKNMGAKHPQIAIVLNNQRNFYQAYGRFDKAGQCMLDANDILLDQLKKGNQFLSGKEVQLYYASIGFQFEINNSFISARKSVNPSLMALSFNNELALKGASLESSIKMRKAIQESGDSILTRTFNQWIDLNDQINRMNNTPVAKRFADVDSLTSVATMLEKDLIRSSQAFSNRHTALGIQWKDVQNHLAANEAAIEFINYRFNNGREFTDSTLYAALMVRPGYEYPQFINLFSEKDLHVLLYDSDAPKDRQIRKNITPEIMQEVYNLAWKPLEQYLDSVTTVYLSSSGLLTTIPFQALMKNSTTCLIDKIDIHYLMSTREKAMNSNEETVEPLTAALFGGIRYDLDTAFLLREAARSGDVATRSYFSIANTRGINSFRYLPETLTEVNQVNGYLTRHNWKTRVFTDTTATEGEFKRLSGKNAPSILHVATHGFYFAPPAPQTAELMQFSFEQRFRMDENPLQRTGLIMAGGNLAWKNVHLPDGVEDGILTAYEISNMDLRKTNLVVLSACETGLGDILAGEGVFGLQRAFRLAGVKTIIMSLWSVSDKTTSELISLYFRYATTGEKKVTAFNHAVTDMRKLYPDEPGKWAAFVMVE